MQGRVEHLADIVSVRLAKEAQSNPLISCAIASSLNSPDQVEVLFYGQEINVRTTELIINAQQEVLMQFYNFDALCNSGEDMLAALVTLNSLAEARQSSIRVRLLVNMRQGPAAYFTKRTSDPFTWLQEDEQGKYIILHGTKTYVPHLDIQTKLHTHSLFDSYHTKQIIIDNQFLMLRSGDIYKYADSRSGQRLRMDMASVIECEAVARGAANSFHARWEGRELQQKFHENNRGQQVPVLLMEKSASTNPMNGFKYHAPLKIALLEGLACAAYSAKIMTPNLNDPDIIDAIIAALLRGVRIEIITGKFMNDDRESKPGMGGTNREAIYKIYQSIPVYFWDNFQVRWACDDYFKLITPKTYNSCMHCKVVILDDCAVITGSSPLDKQATLFSSECDALIVSPDIAKKYDEHVFTPTFKQGENCVHNNFMLLKSLLITSIKKNFADTELLKACLVMSILTMLDSAENFADLAHVIQQISNPQPIPDSGLNKHGLFASSEQVKGLKTACADINIELRKEGIFSSFAQLDF